jgi:phage terminase large subunit-like protein
MIPQTVRPQATSGEKLLFAGGSVRFPRHAAWLKKFIAELLAFPGRAV